MNFIVLDESKPFAKEMIEESKEFLKSISDDEIVVVVKIYHEMVAEGEIVVGHLPFHKADEICSVGCQYYHISWNPILRKRIFEKFYVERLAA